MCAGSNPAAASAPTTAPADVPTIRSASTARHPVSASSASSAPTSHVAAGGVAGRSAGGEVHAQARAARVGGLDVQLAGEAADHREAEAEPGAVRVRAHADAVVADDHPERLPPR